MKKISLKDLEAGGWKVSESEKEKIAAHKSKLDLNAAVKDIAKKIEALAESCVKSNAVNVKAIDSIVGAIIANKPYKNFECAVKRNQKGSISKIFINAK